MVDDGYASDVSFSEAAESLVDMVLVVHQADQRASRGPETAVTLALLEGLRVAACVDAHQSCYAVPETAGLAEKRVCGVVEAQWKQLRDLGAPTSSVLDPLHRHGCFGGPWGQASREVAEDVMRAVALFLLKATRVDEEAFSRCVPPQDDLSPPPQPPQAAAGRSSPALGDGGGDAACGVGVGAGGASMVPLLYPAELAPPGLCDAATLLGRRRRWAGGAGGGGQREEQHGPPHPLQLVAADVSGRYAPLHVAVPELLEVLEQRGVRLSRFVVNLGASDGRCAAGALYDPANCLMLRGFGGVAFEGREEDFLALARRFASRPDVHLRFGWATPSLAAAYAGEVAPRSPDVLKVDVDNCDSCFVEAMLDRFDPKLIHVEIEADLPPALARRSLFVDPGGKVARGEGLGPHGAPGSLGAFLAATRPRYRLLHVEFLNAVLVRADLAPLVDRGFPAAGLSDEERWELGYFCHPLRTTHRHSPDVRLRRLKRFDAGLLADPALELAERRRLAAGLVDASDAPGTEVRLTAPTAG